LDGHIPCQKGLYMYGFSLRRIVIGPGGNTITYKRALSGQKIILLERGWLLMTERTWAEGQAHQGPLCERPWRHEIGGSEYYCTSTVMLWLAATRAWSFVAPVTVIWCVPRLNPLTVPPKPF